MKGYLRKVWGEIQCPPEIGIPRDFLRWVGVSSERKLMEMGFLDLEQLPNIKNNKIVMHKADRYRGELRFAWRTSGRGPNLIGDCYDDCYGRGKTFDIAAVRALITMWELLTRREKQGQIRLFNIPMEHI